MLKALIAIGIAVALVAGIFFFVIPVDALPKSLQSIKQASLPICNQANSAVRVGDKVCRYENSEYVWKSETEEHYAGEPVSDKSHYMYTGKRAYDGTWITTCIPSEWIENNLRYVCTEDHRLTTYKLQSEPIESFTISNSQWIYSGDNDSVLTFKFTNAGNTVLHITSVHIGSEQYGKTFAYSATVEASNSHEVVINTSGVASSINTGNIFPFTVYTKEGVSQTDKVVLEVSDEGLAKQKASELEAERQKELATPKSGIITITSATLKVGSDSSVTIKNLLPNTCNGANWCNNVIIDYVYVNGQQVDWVHFPHWNLMAGGSYTQPFNGVTENTGVIRVTGHVSDSGQQIYAEYTAR